MLLSCSECESVTELSANNRYMRYASICSNTQITRNHSAIVKCSSLESSQRTIAQNTRRTHGAAGDVPLTSNKTHATKRSGGSRLAQTAKWRARTHSSHALDEEPDVPHTGPVSDRGPDVPRPSPQYGTTRFARMLLSWQSRRERRQTRE